MSVISEQEFLAQLYVIQSKNPPSFVLFPESKKIYNVDLESRKVEAPEFLSVEKDHNAETIYFRVNRFHHYIDLSQTTCIIQYITQDKKPHVYHVPFYDVVTEVADKTMLFPWQIDAEVTSAGNGPIQFSIRFYIVEQNEDQTRYSLVYNLNTLLATSRVESGMEVTELSSDFDIEVKPYEELSARIDQLEKRDGVYWIMPDELYANL